MNRGVRTALVAMIGVKVAEYSACAGGWRRTHQKKFHSVLINPEAQIYAADVRSLIEGVGRGIAGIGATLVYWLGEYMVNMLALSQSMFIRCLGPSRLGWLYNSISFFDRHKWCNEAYRD